MACDIRNNLVVMTLKPVMIRIIVLVVVLDVLLTE